MRPLPRVAAALALASGAGAAVLTWEPVPSAAYCAGLPAGWFARVHLFDGSNVESTQPPAAGNAGRVCSRFVNSPLRSGPPEVYHTIRGKLVEGAVLSGCTDGDRCDGSVTLGPADATTPTDVTFRWRPGSPEMQTAFEADGFAGSVYAGFDMANTNCVQAPVTKELQSGACSVAAGYGFSVVSASMTVGSGAFVVRMEAAKVASGLTSVEAFVVTCTFAAGELSDPCAGTGNVWTYSFMDVFDGDVLGNNVTPADRHTVWAALPNQAGVSAPGVLVGDVQPDEFMTRPLAFQLTSKDLCYLKDSAQCSAFAPPCSWEVGQCVVGALLSFSPASGAALTTMEDNTVDIAFDATEWGGAPVENAKVFYTLDGTTPDPANVGMPGGPLSCAPPCHLELIHPQTYDLRALVQARFEGQVVVTKLQQAQYTVAASDNAVCYLEPPQACNGVCEWHLERGVCVVVTPHIQPAEEGQAAPFQNGDKLTATYHAPAAETGNLNHRLFYRVCYVRVDGGYRDEAPACATPFRPYNDRGITLQYPRCTADVCPLQIGVRAEAYLNITIQDNGAVRTTKSATVLYETLLDVRIRRAPPRDNGAFKIALWAMIGAILLSIVWVVRWYKQPVKRPVAERSIDRLDQSERHLEGKEMSSFRKAQEY